MKVTRTDKGLLVEGRELPFVPTWFDELPVGESIELIRYHSGRFIAQIGINVSCRDTLREVIAVALTAQPVKRTVPGWQHSELVLDALLQWWAKQQGGVSLLMHKDGAIEYNGTVYKSLKILLLAQVPIETVSLGGGRGIHVWGPLVEDNTGTWRVAS
jgi:hypothetical protein